MHAERDHLVRHTFPALDERCRKLNVRLLPLDLRWGVTQEEAEQGKALEICLDEIDRARPFFVGILGERYGWVPGTYETADHARFDWLKDPDLPGHSITALEIIHGVLRHEKQRPRSFFYFRDPGFSAQVPEELRADFAAEDETARGRLEKLKGQIGDAYEPADGHLREYPAAFGGIRVDHDLAGDVATAPEELEALRRLAPTGLVNAETWASLGDDDRRLLARHGTVVVTGLEAPGEAPTAPRERTTFAELILKDLWAAIQAEFPPVLEARDELTLERERHLAFVAERTRVVAAGLEGQSHAPSRIFVGRERDLQQLEDYVRQQDKEARPLVVVGRSGSGKTSLLAELASRVEKTSPGLFVIPVFAGLTPASRPVGEVLERITAELGRRYGLEAEDAASEAREAPPLEGLSARPGKTAEERVRAFQSALWKAAQLAEEKGPAVILIDAADQMLETGEGGSLSWLPSLLPATVRIVVSIAEGTSAAQAARVRALPIQPLETLAREEAALAIRRHLEEHRKQLGYDRKRGVDQLQVLLTKEDITLPLYLAAACEELRVHPRFETLSAKIESLPGEVGELLDAVLARIETDHGADMASNALALIACSGEGLTEPELLGLLSDALGKPVPVAHWAPLRRSLAAYLRGTAEGEGGRYFFFHRLLGEAVRRRYLSDPDAERRTYALLADAGLDELDRTLALRPEQRAGQSRSPLLDRVGYALFKAGRDGPARGGWQDDLDTTLVGALHRILAMREEAWLWYRGVFGILVTEVQRNEDEYAPLEEQLLSLARLLADSAEDAWSESALKLTPYLDPLDPLFRAGRRRTATLRLVGFVDEFGRSLRRNGFSVLAGGLFRSQKELLSLRLAAEPLRPGLAVDPYRADLRRDLSVSLHNLGTLAKDAGRSDEARRFFEESLELKRALIAAEPNRNDFRSDFTVSLHSLGQLAQAAGRFDEAWQLFEESLEMMRALVAAEPHRADLRRDLSVSLDNLGSLAKDAGRGDEARKFFQEALETLRALVAAQPHRADLCRDLSVCLCLLGQLASASGRSDDAQRFLGEALGVTQALVAAEPHRADLRSDLSACLHELGKLAMAGGRNDEALRSFEESLEICRALVATEPHRADLRRGLSVVLNGLGNLAMAAGRNDEALRFFEESLEIGRALIAAEPHRGDLRRDLLASLNLLGTLAEDAGRSDDARRHYGESLEFVRALVTAEPQQTAHRHHLLAALIALGRLAQSAGRNDEALRFLEEALEVVRPLVAAEPHRGDTRRALAWSLQGLGALAQAAGRSDEALLFFEECLQVMRALVAAEPLRADLGLALAISCWNVFQTCPASGETRRLTEAQGILEGLLTRGFRNAKADHLLGLVQARLAASSVSHLSVEIPNGAPECENLWSPPHPRANPHEAARLNIEYQKALAHWKALPWWKRLRVKKPEPPKGF